MEMKEEFTRMLEKLKTERDELKLKLHLASMEGKEEFEEAEKKWQHLKVKAADMNENLAKTTSELMSSTKIIGEELQQTYQRIAKRLQKENDDN